MSIHKRHNQPTAMVIFGGTGNLATTKLFPALFDLYLEQLLPDMFTIVGLARKNFTPEEYRAFVADSIRTKRPVIDEGLLTAFCAHITFISGSFDDDASYVNIVTELMWFDASIGLCTSKLFYLAVPPALYSDIFARLHTSKLMEMCNGIDSWSRLLIEKPFGRDLKTAQELEALLAASFPENQIYRIDHYLAKDAIENIISLRFANSILADSWNGTKIESITLRLHEAQDVSTRGAFYDVMGAVRDVGQNHMLQMLALLIMSPADVHSSTEIRESRLSALRSLRIHDTDSFVRGQYKGYRDTPGVAPDSTTETYFKLETHIDSESWKDVKVTLESGKALDASLTEAVLTFRPFDVCMCAPTPEAHEHKNVLRITFSPKQSIRLTMWVKEAGFDFRLVERELVLDESTQDDAPYSPEAYERVLYDCIVGDQTRFVSGAEVIAAWTFISPIIEAARALPLHEYEKGAAAEDISSAP